MISDAAAAESMRDPARADRTKVHSSRRYNHWLGGNDSFAADRASADRIAQVFPFIRLAARENRRFLHRTVSWLAEQAGVRQFLDLGAGIPLSPNVHDLVQAIAPESRVVYVDNDPLVVAYGKARTSSTPQGTVAYVRGDLRESDRILDGPKLRTVLDFTQPVGLLLVAVLHFLDEADQPDQAVDRLIEALPSGSFLVISHACYDRPFPQKIATELEKLTTVSAGHGVFRARSREEIARFLTGTHPLNPGLVPIVEWRPGLEPHPKTTGQIGMLGAVAKIP